MKKRSLLLFALLFSAASVFMAACSKDEDPIDEDTLAVTFTDANLAAFIKVELLDLPASAEITRGDLKTLTNLTIRGQLDNVTSLVGLEYATELTVVDFGGNPVSDLTPIKDLKKVTYLRMNESAVTDLSPISEYTTLTYFNANQASPGISDLAPLSKNTNLGSAILRAQPLGNEGLASLAPFTKLYRLNIRDTGVTDISVIAELLSKGAFLNSTPGADELGSDPVFNFQGLAITNCELLDPYRADLAGLIEGACR